MNHLNDDFIDVLSFQSIKEGKSQCGDGIFYHSDRDYFLAVLADGLGSGEYASISAQAVIQAARVNKDQDVHTIMVACNDTLKNKRGAALSVLKIYYEQKEFVYSCVGNIRFYFYGKDGRMIFPLPVNGYLSGRPQRYNVQRYHYETPSRFFIHSDGLKSTIGKNQLKLDIPSAYIYYSLVGSITLSDDTTFLLGDLH